MQSSEVVSSLFVDELYSEGVHKKDLIICLYKSLLKREPDPSGLRHYLNLLDNGACISDIVFTFMDSEEYSDSLVRSCGSGQMASRVAMIDDLYLAFFDQAANAESTGRYLDILIEEGLKALVVSMLNSKEFRIRSRTILSERMLNILRGIFPESNYLVLNADLKNMSMTGVEHFVKHGMQEGRHAHRVFAAVRITEGDWRDGYDPENSQ